MSTSRPVTPGSPKSVKIKSPEPGVPRFGCEHVRIFLTAAGKAEQFLKNFKDCLQVVANGGCIPQSTDSRGRGLTTLTTNYLCLQCPHTSTDKGRVEHGAEKKHRLYLESRSGCVFCQMCNDFIWDPTLEDIRLRRLGTGYFSSKKRKQQDMFTDTIKEDLKTLSSSLAEASCGTSGIRGIYNMGATCYMNVILQSIVHNPLLRNYYLGDNHQRAPACTIKNCMSCAMDDMFQEFYANEVTVGYSASNILASFWLSKRKAYEELASNKEQDAHEFFTFLLEELHEINSGSRQPNDDQPTPKRPRTGSDGICRCIIHQTFYGKSQSTITCQECGANNTSFQSFMDVSLGVDGLSKKQIAKGASLTLKRRLDEEYLDGEACEYNCRDCGSSQAKKVSSIKSLPNALCIQLKRFKQVNGTASKIDTPVSFPLKLDMFPYTSRAKGVDPKQYPELTRSCTYDLQSVVVQVGALDTGHYVSYSRVNGQWFKFNDHMVKPATKSEVLNEQAFLLFYVIQSLA